MKAVAEFRSRSLLLGVVRSEASGQLARRSTRRSMGTPQKTALKVAGSAKTETVVGQMLIDQIVGFGI